MLVLTRKPGQKVIIGNDVTVTVLEVRGESVKVGIDAPKTVSIYRNEVFEEICKSNQAASQANTAKDLLDNATQFIMPQSPKS